MPRYDYKCDSCPIVLEYEHPMSETMDWHPCPVELRDGSICEGHLHKVFSPTPSVFRGTGWGKVTEYKPKKNL